MKGSRCKSTRNGWRYFLKALLDPFIPVAEHVEPFHFPLSGNFNSGFLLTETVETLTLAAQNISNNGHSVLPINR